MIEFLTEFLISIGPIGLFFAAIIANASMFLPLPIDLLIIPMAAHEFYGLGIFTPLFLGVLAGVGSAIGEFSGYIIGFAGVKTFEKMSKGEVRKLALLKEKLENKKYDLMSFFIIAFFAFTPLPFDIIGIAAGLAKYSRVKFFLACAFGKILRYIVLAYAGFLSVPWILSLFGA